MIKIAFYFSFLLGFINPVLSKTAPAYKRSDLPIEDRIKNLLLRMTKEEKFWQLFMIPGASPFANANA